MTKGASIKFTSYQDAVPKLLALLKVQNELKKYDRIILKPYIKNSENYTSKEFVESVLRFCLQHKNPVAEIVIAEGVDGFDTSELFESTGYQNLAEKYSVGLIDLNDTEVVELVNDEYQKFDSIKYPRIMLESCIISLPLMQEDEETQISDSLTNMLGAFSSQHYAGFFSLKKSKIRKWPIKYSIHDILKCKMPNFTIVDASKYGLILAGLPFEMDKQIAKMLGKDWRSVSHLKLIEESFSSSLNKPDKEPEKAE